MIKSVIFDLDGTLIDSMPVWYLTDKLFLEENGIEYPPDVSEAVKKMRTEEASLYFIERFGLPHTQEYIINRIEEMVKEQYDKEIPLKPHVTELLDYLDKNNIPYGIATSTYRTLAESCLTRLGIIDRFKFIITCSELNTGKTEPYIFLKSAEMLGTQPQETAVVEDSLHCIETASQAGFYTIGVYDESTSHEWNLIKKKSHLPVNDLSEIIKYGFSKGVL